MDVSPLAPVASSPSFHESAWEARMETSVDSTRIPIILFIQPPKGCPDLVFDLRSSARHAPLIYKGKYKYLREKRNECSFSEVPRLRLIEEQCRPDEIARAKFLACLRNVGKKGSMEPGMHVPAADMKPIRAGQRSNTVAPWLKAYER
jgi:hypothetical protein